MELLEIRRTRIIELIDIDFKGNVRQASLTLDIPYATLYSIYTKSRKVGDKVIMLLERAGYNKLWFESLQETSKMSASNNFHRSNGYASEDNRRKALPLSEPSNVKNYSPLEEIQIKFFVKPANAGIGIDTELDVDTFIKVPKNWVRRPELSFAMSVSGDSMAMAGIKDGSIVLCQHLENQDGELSKFVDSIVIAQYNGVTYIKRLLKNEDGMYLHSENPDTKAYKDMPLNDFANYKVVAIALKVMTDLV